MHELSVAESICRSVMARAGDAAVDEMIVEVGTLSGVSGEALEFCLGEAARAAGLRLGRFRVDTVAPVAACSCGHNYETLDLLQPCPRCGGFSRSLTGGDDVVVRRLVLVESNEPETKNP